MMKTKFITGMLEALTIASLLTTSQGIAFEIELGLTSDGNLKNTEVTVNGYKRSEITSPKFVIDLLARSICGFSSVFVVDNLQTHIEQFHNSEDKSLLPWKIANLKDAQAIGSTIGSLLNDHYYQQASKETIINKAMPTIGEVVFSRLVSFNEEIDDCIDSRLLGRRAGHIAASALSDKTTEQKKDTILQHAAQAVGEQSTAIIRNYISQANYIPTSVGANFGLACYNPKLRSAALLKSLYDALAYFIVNKGMPRVPEKIVNSYGLCNIINHSLKESATKVLSIALSEALDKRFAKASKMQQEKTI